MVDLDAIRARRQKQGLNVEAREPDGEWQTYSFRDAERRDDFIRRARINGLEVRSPQ